MPKHSLYALLAGLFILASCAPSLNPKLTKRYSQIWVVDQDTMRNSPKWADISAFSLPARQESNPRDLFSLSGEGQAALIDALAVRSQDAQALSRALSANIQQDRAVSILDLSATKRRIVFSVGNRSRSPADRLTSVRLHLVPLDGTEFTGWDKLATEYQTIDLGKLSFGQTFTAGGELGAAVGALSPKATVSAGSQVQEEVPLQQRLVALSGFLSPKHMILLQQAGSGQDLTGNVVVDLDLRLPRTPLATITSVVSPGESDGQIDCAKKPSFRQQRVIAPQNTPILGTVVLEYVLRRVISGHSTLYEGDDVVVHHHGADTLRNIVLIPESDLAFRVWRLTGPSDALLQAGSGTPTKLQLLQFASYDDALRLENWIENCGATTISGLHLLLNDNALPEGTKPVLRITLADLNPAPPGRESER